ncbi:MAG: LemA family protein [candidate division Zixibacteria bacterium]|nr:LemA family protein [candidate division Zixibacteria bacterium]MDH3937251.1 LemA family protein [candidate division Zixibacteria bacterium]MDH4033285.1 LemA family protein [candidate division Zixibacteria bacterium]
MTTLLVILGIGALVLIVVIAMYNRLVKLRNTVRSSWSDIDVQLKKRYNLVPNLVETVKAYAKHEKSVFENVAQARSAAMQAGSPAEQAKSDNIFKDTLKSLFAVAEAYPELKANSNFMQLQKQFQDLEEDIESARRYYNAVVRDYNTLTETFPSVLIASNCGFQQEEFYQMDAPDTQRQPPRADFS